MSATHASHIKVNKKRSKSYSPFPGNKVCRTQVEKALSECDKAKRIAQLKAVINNFQNVLIIIPFAILCWWCQSWPVMAITEYSCLLCRHITTSKHNLKIRLSWNDTEAFFIKYSPMTASCNLYPILRFHYSKRILRVVRQTIDYSRSSQLSACCFRNLTARSQYQNCGIYVAHWIIKPNHYTMNWSTAERR